MIRRAFRIASLLSLLLFAASAVVRFRSQFRSDMVLHVNNWQGDRTAAQLTDEGVEE